jgi:putative nucleotidyltransferase with HDIG domain
MVFADLMPWGWLRRSATEHLIKQPRRLLGISRGGSEWDRVSSNRRIVLLERMIARLEARDVYTLGHSRRVGRHAERIAQTMGLTSANVAMVRTGAALHDIGKAHTPRAILNKPGPLTAEEFAIIKRHPVDGADMIERFCDEGVTATVRHHHERLDGKGYPDGLSGTAIPLGSRIIAVADTFDAMTSLRSYRPRVGHKRALNTLADEAGTQLDARAVAAFLSYYSGRRAVGWWAALIAAPQRALPFLGSLPGGFVGATQGALALGGLVAIAGIAGHSSGAERLRVAQHPLPHQSSAGLLTVAPGRSGHAIVPTQPVPKVHTQPVPKVPGSVVSGPTASTPSATAPAVTGPAVAGTTPTVATPVIPAPKPVIPAVTTPVVATPAVTIPSVAIPSVAIPSVAIPSVTTPNVTIPTITTP